MSHTLPLQKDSAIRIVSYGHKSVTYWGRSFQFILQFLKVFHQISNPDFVPAFILQLISLKDLFINAEELHCGTDLGIYCYHLLSMFGRLTILKGTNNLISTLRKRFETYTVCTNGRFSTSLKPVSPFRCYWSILIGTLIVQSTDVMDLHAYQTGWFVRLQYFDSARACKLNYSRRRIA